MQEIGRDGESHTPSRHGAVSTSQSTAQPVDELRPSDGDTCANSPTILRGHGQNANDYPEKRKDRPGGWSVLS
jgi:hypothetical protein